MIQCFKVLYTTHTLQRNTEDLWEVTGMFTTFTVVISSWVYAYIQTYQTVHIMYVQVFVYQLYPNQA